jgi:hypothetical protein
MAMCFQESKVLNKVKKLVSKQVGEAGQEKVFFFLQDEMGLFLKQEAAKLASTETIIGGRKVKTVLRPIPQEKEKSARQSVLKVLFAHIRRKKDVRQKGFGWVPNFCINRFLSRISKDRTPKNRLSLANGKYQELSGYAPNLPRFQRIYRFAVLIPFGLFSIVAVLRPIRPLSFLIAVCITTYYTDLSADFGPLV